MIFHLLNDLNRRFTDWFDDLLEKIVNLFPSASECCNHDCNQGRSCPRKDAKS